MKMYDKILEKLKSQRGTTSNVSDRSLEDMARSLETLVTDDTILEKANFTKAIESFDGNLNNYTAKQVEAAKKKAIEDSKKSAEDLAKEEAAKKAAKEKAEKDGDKTDPAITALLEQNKVIMEQLQGIKNEKETQSRSDLLQAEIKETPLMFKQATEKAFNRMNFETDEAFTEYLTEIKTSAVEAIQIGKESGLAFTTPTKDVHKPNPDEVSPEMEKAIEKLTTKTEEKKPF